MTHELTADRLAYWQRAAQNAHDDRPGTVLSVPAEELLALVERYLVMEQALVGMVALDSDAGTLGGFLKLARRALEEYVRP